MLIMTKDREILNLDNVLEIRASEENVECELMNGYIQIGDESTIKTMSEVNLMTPENIHLNSFMYEPILDMDIVELLHLYEQVGVL